MQKKRISPDARTAPALICVALPFWRVRVIAQNSDIPDRAACSVAVHDNDFV